MRTLSLTLVLACALARPCPGDWPSFLGGSARSASSEIIRIPTTWSESEGLIWKSPLTGHGQSSPVVVGDNVYVTAIDGPMKDSNLVFGINLESGKLQWTHKFPNPLKVKNDPYTSRAAPTPVADEDGVYAFFESGNLVALTPAGEKRWERDLLSDYGKYQGRFGLGGSLAQSKDHVFVLADNEGPAYLLAIEKSSGKTAWKTDRSSRTAWSSPMMLNVGGTEQIVVSAAGSIDGYDAKTGEVLWTISDVGGNTVASPMTFGDGKFLVGASPGRNGENSAGARRSNMAVQVLKQGEDYVTKVLWRNEQATSSFGTPVVYNGRAYYVNRSGAVFCINAETGETLFTKRIAESTWATPVGNGNRIFFFGQTGDTTVIESGDEFNRLAVNRLFSKPADGGGPGGFNAEIQYGVAVTPAGLLVRTGSNLYLVGPEEG